MKHNGKANVFFLTMSTLFCVQLVQAASMRPHNGQLAQLRTAIINGQTARARQLLCQGVRACSTDPRTGQTLLHLAARHGRRSIARQLIERGARVHTVDRAGKTPLHEAAAHEHVTAARLLLKEGAHANAQDESGETPLHCAAKCGDSQMIFLLLDEGALINQPDQKGKTPLHHAAENGRGEATWVLCRSGADVGAKNFHYSQAIPLHLATIAGHELVVWTLLEHGTNVNAQDTDGNTALHFACGYGHGKICARLVRVLIDRGANVNVHNDLWGCTPLQALLQTSGNSKVISLLLSRGADVNALHGGINANLGMLHPLHSAVEHGDLELVDLMLMHDADTEATENSRNLWTYRDSYNDLTLLSRYTPLRLSLCLLRNTLLHNNVIAKKHFAVAKLLLSRGAELTPATQIKYLNPEILKYLEEHTYNRRLKAVQQFGEGLTEEADIPQDVVNSIILPMILSDDMRNDLTQLESQN